MLAGVALPVCAARVAAWSRTFRNVPVSQETNQERAVPRELALLTKTFFIFSIYITTPPTVPTSGQRSDRLAGVAVQLLML